MRHTNRIENLIRDFAYAIRTLRKSPIFAATVAVTLALGIGASTAIFSVTNAVLLRPLPYRDADRLVLVFWENRQANNRSFLYSNADFFDLRAGTGAIFDDIGGVAGFRAFVPREDGTSEQIDKALVTTNFFRLMGAKIVLGRDFTEADAVPQPAQPAVLIPPGSAAILSYEYWQRRYAGSAAVLGQEMPGSSQRGLRIVGVLAPGFKLFFPPGAMTPDAAPDFWVANNIGYDTAHRNLLTVGAIGRLRGGITLRQAQDRLDALGPELRKSSFDPAAALRLEPMRRYLVKEVRPAILSLMGAVIFLLLIACANVANLLLVRAWLRERELAVRAALGGSWWRLASQMLAEALLLSGLGTVLGVVFAWLGIHVLAGIAPATLPRIESTAIDWHVLAFAAAAGLAAVAVFGVIPAAGAARPDVNQVLRGGRTPGLGPGHLLRSTVVVAEVALSFVLLIGSGLMFRSFLELRRVDPGYDPRGLLTFFVTRDWQLTRQQGRLELLRETQDRLRALPGVRNATAALVLPLGGGSRPGNPDAARPQPAPASADGADFQQVMPGYFETLRTPLLAGRTFTEDDNAPGRNVVVVDQLFAAKAFPNESAVGKRILLPDPATPWAEVIGVIAHQRLFSLSDPGRRTVYYSDGFWGIGVSRYWIVRTAGDPAKYAAAIRAELARVDRTMVISKMRPMEALVDQNQAGTRLSLLLIGTFGAISVLLASVGLYGVLATVVRQRTAEMGVRMALGADPASIFKLIVGHGLRLTALGLAIGLLAALGLTRMMTTMLVGVAATDPSTFAAATLLFFLVATVASALPAARAAGLDANAALHEE
jgi:putative ABC transport system permease protein